MSRGAPWRTARRMWALHQGPNDWYRIKNQADGPTQLYIYDEIGYFGVGAGDLVRDLADVKGPVEVHLNSPGGEVWDGITIYNALMSRRDVTVVIDGLAASIASVIACAGSPTLIAKQGEVLIHDGHTMAIGNAQDMRELAEKLDRASDNIASIYADRTGKTEAYWRDLMKVETTFSAQEAVEAGLADKVVQASASRQVNDRSGDWDLSNVVRNAASVPYVGRDQHRHVPMTGRHQHDHAAFGASDADDGAHIHAHEHTNDADHDHDHSNPTQTGPDADNDYDMDQVRLLAQVLDIELDLVLNWDAAAALAKCKTASDYRKVCAGERSSGDPDTQDHWALPHHNSPGAGPDKGGVVAALGRWNQAEGLKNKDAALSHLKSHARALGLPSGEDDKLLGWELTDDEVSRMIEALRG